VAGKLPATSIAASLSLLCNKYVCVFGALVSLPPLCLPGKLFALPSSPGNPSHHHLRPRLQLSIAKKKLKNVKIECNYQPNRINWSSSLSRVQEQSAVYYGRINHLRMEKRRFSPSNVVVYKGIHHFLELGISWTKTGWKCPEVQQLRTIKVLIT
jgi:hypothetical protein